MTKNPSQLLTRIALPLALALLGLAASCKKDKPDPTEPTDSFDRAAMLGNCADSVILPNLQAMQSRMSTLQQNATAFTQNPDLTGLLALRNDFQAAYLAYEQVCAFEFGPSETELIRANCNTFPTDTAQIHANIASGSYDLFTAANLDAKGFPALDFLLHGKNMSDNTIVSLFASSANRRAYLNDLVSHLASHFSDVLNGWTGGYRGTFIASTGNDIGSSMGYMVNQLCYDLEQIKNARVGIPLGKFSMGVPFPEKCENYYSGQSVPLALACLDNIESFYLGRSRSGANGKGLDDHLDHLGAQHTSGSLNTAIKNQFISARTKLQAVSDPLSVQVVSNPALVDTAYVALQKLTVLLKTDMPSALGVVITYQDTDGD